MLHGYVSRLVAAMGQPCCCDGDRSVIVGRESSQIVVGIARLALTTTFSRTAEIRLVNVPGKMTLEQLSI